MTDQPFEQVDAPRRWVYRRLMAFSALLVILVITIYALMREIPDGNQGVVTTVVYACVAIILAFFGNNALAEFSWLKGQK